MYTTQCVLGLIVLYVGCTQSWDIAVTCEDKIEFYTNESKSDTVHFNSHKLTTLAYDEVHNMLLYVDKRSNNDTICGYGISSKLNQCFFERNGRNIHGLTFDPVTEVMFFSDTNERSINWISLKPGSSTHENLLIKMDHGIPTDVAVDSCRRYVYWINTNLTTARIERVRFNGSEREVVININLSSTTTTDKLEPHSLIIDQPTQIIYWIESSTRGNENIYYAHINENVLNRTHLNYLSTYNTLYSYPLQNTLTVSNTKLIYLYRCNDCGDDVWKLGKIEWTGLDTYPLYNRKGTVGIATNYKIKERIQDLNDCETLITPGTPGFVGERCHVSKCENYCLQGNCSITDEGLPTCRCNAGYSGKRCEVDACHGYCSNDGECSLNEKSEPICQCKGDHAGARCEISDCVNYCIQGNCSFSDDGLPQCRCKSGYSGERCEVAACHGYCLNYGDCSLNEEEEPSCECVDGYEGSRCETVQNDTPTTTSTPIYSGGKNLTLADLLANYRKPKILVIVDDY